MGLSILLTGATGMAGEGVLLTCLAHPDVQRVLVVGRRPCGLQHAKLSEVLVPDFTQLEKVRDALKGFDACFFCAGISSVGMNESRYTHITYTTTLAFARTLAELQANMTFIYITGAGTDSSEKGRIMWARVKGRTENDLQQLGFHQQFNFRPGGMTPVKGQKNAKLLYVVLVTLLKPFLRRHLLSLEELGLAMIHATQRGYDRPVLEVQDIRKLARP